MNTDWQKELDDALAQREEADRQKKEQQGTLEKETADFFKNTVYPALQKIETYFQEKGFLTKLNYTRDWAEFEAVDKKKKEFSYTLNAANGFTYVKYGYYDRTKGEFVEKDPSAISKNSPKAVSQVKSDDIIRYIVDRYKEAINS